MNQTKRMSIVETFTNVISGMFIAFAISQLAHYFGPEIREYLWSGFRWDLSAGSNAIMTCILTSFSMARSYFCRRTFNKLQG